jgi:hypothetical protein
MNHKSIIAYLAILGIIGLSITAQAQTEFAPVGATWEYDFTGEAYTGTELIKVADTLSFGNKTFKVLTSRIDYRSNFSNQIRTKLDTFFLEERNDSIFFRYRYDLIVGGRELLYFTPNASDSINVYEYSYYINRGLFDSILIEGKDRFVIEQINECLINGTISTNVWEGYSRIGQKGDIFLEEQLPLRFSEKFGPINDFFRYYALDQDQNKQASFQYPKVTLVAYQDEDIGAIRFEDVECTSSLNFSNFYNPVDDLPNWHLVDDVLFLTWKNPLEEALRIVIFDEIGRQIHTVFARKYEKSCQINFRTNRQGIYFIQMIDQFNQPSTISFFSSN